MKVKTAKTIIIRKYENRRLYNTATSQYINQEQVAQLVRDGYDVRVIDVATGEDITRLILAQIVLEDAKEPNSVFPLDVLRQMVVASGKATQENALRYFKAMMDMYQNAYRMMPSPMNPFEVLPGFWGQSQGKNEPAAGPATATGNSGSAPPQKTEAEELRRRIEELEAALSRSPGREKARKPKSRRKS